MGTQCFGLLNRFFKLSDGVVSQSSGFGSAASIGTGALVAGDDTTVTRQAGQRLYFNRMGPPLIRQDNRRHSRFAVVLTHRDGSASRVVNARSFDKAKQFADALETLRIAAPEN